MPLAKKPFQNLFHIDAYRLSPRANLSALGLKEFAREPDNVLAVEWPEAVRAALPSGALQIRFAHGARMTERRITLPKTLQ